LIGFSDLQEVDAGCSSLQFKFSSEVKPDPIASYFQLDLIEETEKRKKRSGDRPRDATLPSLSSRAWVSSRSMPHCDHHQARRQPSLAPRACASLITARLDRLILPARSTTYVVCAPAWVGPTSWIDVHMPDR
jgi:hypothetical protein